MGTTRRKLLQLLAGCPFLGLVAAKTEVSTSSRLLLNVFSVAGLAYYEGENLLPCLKAGQLLDLRAEPENPYDAFAVSIRLGRAMLGYVPRSDNRHISRLLRQDAHLTCRVVEVDPTQFPSQALRVEVLLKA